MKLTKVLYFCGFLWVSGDSQLLRHWSTQWTLTSSILVFLRPTGRGLFRDFGVLLNHWTINLATNEVQVFLTLGFRLCVSALHDDVSHLLKTSNKPINSHYSLQSQNDLC